MGATASIAQAASTAGNAWAQSRAQAAQAEYQRQQYDFNAAIAERQSADAIKRGDEAAKKVGADAKRTIGAQRAALAAQGIAIDSGSALDVQVETAELAAADQMKIKNNAWREAWGFKVQALDATNQGRFAELSGKAQARNTILTGGLSALGYTADAFGKRNGGKK